MRQEGGEQRAGGPGPLFILGGQGWFPSRTKRVAWAQSESKLDMQTEKKESSVVEHEERGWGIEMVDEEETGWFCEHMKLVSTIWGFPQLYQGATEGF